MGITSAHVFPYEKLSEVQIDLKALGSPRSTWGRFALMILEKDTGDIQVIHIDQECVTKVSIEAPHATPELMLETTSLFEQHNLSILYKKHLWGETWCLDMFLREIDVTPLVLDLKKVDGISKLEILQLCAQK